MVIIGARVLIIMFNFHTKIFEASKKYGLEINWYKFWNKRYVVYERKNVFCSNIALIFEIKCIWQRILHFCSNVSKIIILQPPDGNCTISSDDVQAICFRVKVWKA